MVMKENEYSRKAGKLFCEGYNCAQSVFCAFSDDLGINFETALKLSSSFGGGMGRLREVCGAVSAMFMIAGLKYGYTSPDDDKIKAQHYARIQQLAEEFKKNNKSIICRELLGLDIQQDSPIPAKRTEQYYKARPCEQLVKEAAYIISNYINSTKHS
ncbi:c_GCAxxG_C_C family protein [Fusobacterium sp. CAG:439]|nr:c_GCAxxG_C_C family protein [Fusobacterium sp. CAG:439]